MLGRRETSRWHYVNAAEGANDPGQVVHRFDDQVNDAP
jgi:hypothetical protein